MDRGPVKGGSGGRNADGRRRQTPRDPARPGEPAAPTRTPDEDRPRSEARSVQRPTATRPPDRPSRESPAASRPEGAVHGNRPASPGGGTPGRDTATGRRTSPPPKPVPIAAKAERTRAPERPSAAARPRRLPTRQADEPAAGHPEPAQMPDEPDRWEDKLERRRELKRSLKSRRSALPSTPQDDEPAAAPRHPRPAGTTPPPAPAEPDAPYAAEAAPEAEPAAEALAPDRQAAFRAPPDDHTVRTLVDAPDSDAIVENGPIVAPNTVSGRSLTAVVAIMTFLCALLLGSAIIIDRAASAWSASVLDDISVTVLPLDGDPVERRLADAAALMRDTPGLSDVVILPAAQSEALLEPWLGSGTDLSLLPVPRLITAMRSGQLDAAALEAALAAVPGTSLDDHTGWSERLSRMAGSIAGGAIVALALMLGATTISIVFATRAAIATNAVTVEVLHVLGAEDGFIVRAFRGRFMRIGLRGALIGLVGALVLFGALETWSMLSAGAASRQAEALLGSPRIGPFGFVAILVLGLLVCALVTVTTSLAVRHHLKNLSL